MDLLAPLFGDEYNESQVRGAIKATSPENGEDGVEAKVDEKSDHLM